MSVYERFSSLRYVTKRKPQLLPQFLDVPPLALVDGLSGQVDVIDRQLGLVEEPLHHEHRACRVERTFRGSDFKLRIIFCLAEKLGVCGDSLFNVG